MHLESLKIKNFRLLEDVEVKKLGHVNLIVGKNNSGKSTVLEALALLASGFDPKVVNQLVSNRSANRHRLHQSTDYEKIFIQSLFNNQSFIPQDLIYIGSNNFYLRVGAKDSSDKGGYYDKRVKISSNTHDYATLKSDIVSDYSFLAYQDLLVSSNYRLNKKISKPFMFASEIKPARPNYEIIDTNIIDIEQLALYWDDIALTDNELLLVQMLQLIEPKIKNIAFLSDEKFSNRTPYVRLEGIQSRVPLHSMGDGIFRLLQIILKVIKAKDGFLLIDEFENGLHYSVQSEVWRLIFELAKRFNIQVFATTHSWDCIESFAKVAKEREDLEGVLFRMGRSAKKSDNGKVIATVYDEDELYYITKAKMEVR